MLHAHRSARSLSVGLSLTVMLMTSRVFAVSPDVVISQVYGGGGNAGATLRNDFIELFNLGSSTVDLSGWSVQYAPSSAGSWQVTPLSGTIAPGQHYLIQEAVGSGGSVNLPTPDATGMISMSSSSGVVALVHGSTVLASGCQVGAANVVDLLGFGTTSCAETSPSATLTNTTAAIRINGGCADTDSNQIDFSTGAPAPRNTAAALTPCSEAAPAVTGTTPANGATGVSQATTITVTFSEPINVAAGAITVECPAGNTLASNAAVSGVTSVAITPASNLPAITCRIGVLASGVSDVDTLDPPDTLVSNFSASFTVTTGAPCSAADTPIGQIQGTGTSAALSGTRTVQGVVVADFEYPGTGTSTDYLRGFYLQNTPSNADGDPATSDAIFVFNGSANSVSVGQIVQVTGSVSEFNYNSVGGTLTELTTPAIEICGGQGSVTPVDVTLPVSTPDDLERYEGMLVHFPQTLSVTEHFQLGRFGQVELSSGGRLPEPTQIADPGAPALAQNAANALRSIVLDDDLQMQNPDPIRFGRGGAALSASNTLRGGDTISGLTGVLTQTDATTASNVTSDTDPVRYRVRPFNVLGEQTPMFQAVNARPNTPVAASGRIKVAGFNLLNYFNTFSGCTLCVGGAATDCRGANTAAEFARQWPKTVAAALGTGADILVVNELENDGYGPDSAMVDLVGKLNNATAPGTFAFIDVDARTGQSCALGVDAIRVGMIYKPAVVTPIGTTAVANTGAFGIFQTGSGAMQRSRPALAQAFQDACGGRVIVVGNHLKSKSSSCADNVSPVGPDPDQGDGQGDCNLTRAAAAEQLVTWLQGNPTGTGESKILIMGDMNSYAHEDPIVAFENGGYTNLVSSRIGDGAYSYVFDGAWGYLDHALASNALTGLVDSVVEAHFNADEPSVLDYNVEFKSAGQVSSLYNADAFRASDHDPLVVGLTLGPCSQPVPALARGRWLSLGVLGLLVIGVALTGSKRRSR